MKLVFIRHGDPDYAIDSLTEKGWREARLLAPRVQKLNADRFYMSPLGRAQDTARTALAGTGIEPEVRDWMREFNGRIIRPGDNGQRAPICWDWLPEDWTVRPAFYDYDKWYLEPEMAEADIEGTYKSVCQGLEELLNENGYRKDGKFFRAVKPNNDTIVIFCHLGATCVFLSYLLSISPMVLWQGFSPAPTSVTTVVTEERRPGVASFRVSQLGDISHLYAGGEEPAFSGRFCEAFTNSEERHD